jgi:anti-repressor protein
MNNALIKIEQTEFNGQLKQTVNARELHQFLESRQEFANWIKNRLEDFSENVDFISIDKIIKRENGANKSKDYLLTIETAKHISMMERNEKGKQIRQYFIDVEEKARNALKIPTTMQEVLELALEQEKEKKRLLSELAKEKAVNRQLDQYMAIDRDMSFTECAKTLHLHPKKFIEKLVTYKYISAKSPHLPMTKYITSGFFRVVTTTIDRISSDTGTSKSVQQVKITNEGFRYFKSQKLYKDIFNDIVAFPATRQAINDLSISSNN